MFCELCGGALKLGQFYVELKQYLTQRDPHYGRAAVPIVFENGKSKLYAHTGCLMRCAPPALSGIGLPDA